MIRRTLDRLLFGLLVFLPAIAVAHPGHYHPGEEDEFDQLRADHFHLHGYLEIGLATLALAAYAVFRFHSNRKVRIGAALALGGSLALIAAF
ncbi:hypothetical protein [Luteolibacter sp. Populi]|uniref:hypothetical protein n=1 Tax=Luteolibacter sp. Populi TaxID=3230487 RepID=UPI003465ED5A